MTRSLEYPNWYAAIIIGSCLNIAAFMLMPSLGYNKPVPDVPVIMVDFMEWREPVARKAPKVAPVKPVAKPKVKPKPKLQPKRLIKKAVIQPVIKKEVKLTGKITENRQTVSEKEIEEIPEIHREPVVENLPESKVEPKESLPTPVPVFKLTSMPRFVHRAQFYPPTMRSLGKEATVKLEVLINKKGEVRRVRVLESAGEIFDQAAIDSMKASTFIPGNVEGKAVAVLMRMPVTFRLR